MKKVELLAPAGNFHALIGAIKAGADAIYLGGELYGARAFADNFTKEEICEGIRLAHIFGKRIYLTVNTLVKEKELDGLYDFLLPLYEEGLDGVIIQDLGVLRYLRTYFPGLSLHASTQMTLTGSLGTTFIQKEGISRIVPARELSLNEIKKIKLETGVEIEAFIHGAMCYCYSGQCLFSSMLGGRSGNRGRCAQPCRLPYETAKETRCYPLSMRDMCTIEMLPDLIEAGIDSFKIEGRMKKPAYAAGVTAVYRKYIDLYYQDKKNYKVSKEDMDILSALYIRSETGDGYYRHHNGKEMISIDSPAYSETDSSLLADIEKKYIDKELCLCVDAKICLETNKPACLTLNTDDISVTCNGEMVQKALKQPLTLEKIKDQIKKSGNSSLKIKEVEVIADEAVFLPVSSLNELRRMAVLSMENEMIRRNTPAYLNRKSVSPDVRRFERHANFEKRRKKNLHAFVRSREQLEAASESNIKRIYVDYSFLEGELSENFKSYIINAKNNDLRFYLATPYIVREKDRSCLEKIEKEIKTEVFDGVLVRNLESYQFFCDKIVSEKIVLDANLYVWNRETLRFWEDRAKEFFLPVECNGHEWEELLRKCPERKLQASAIIYGRLPMMITANCIKKTMGKCEKVPGVITLKDRYKKQFPVYTDCLCCYNVLYNSVPLSLHKMISEKKCCAENFRLDFTTEGKQETLQIIGYFSEILKRYREPFYKDYTTGHYKRGVE